MATKRHLTPEEISKALAEPKVQLFLLLVMRLRADPASRAWAEECVAKEQRV